MRRLFLIALALATVPFMTSAAPDTLVAVDGGQISGTTANGVRAFKGIPFAAPPVGDLRWKAPQPVVPWQGVRAADAFGAPCMQEPYPASSPYARSGVTAAAPPKEACL